MKNIKSAMEHLKTHQTYPATKPELVKTCNELSDFSKEDKTWFEEHLPEIYSALRITNPSIDKREWNLTLEVAQHIGENTVRCVSMDSTDGLVRGMPVFNTGKDPIR